MKYDELRKLAEASAPGPWDSQAVEDRPDALVYGPDGDSLAYLAWNAGNDYDMEATAAYIAAASPDVILALLDERERLREALIWALRNNGGECPADYPAGYAKALRALLPEPSDERLRLSVTAASNSVSQSTPANPEGAES